MPFECYDQKTLVYIIYCLHNANTPRISICHLECLKLGNLKVVCANYSLLSQSHVL